ncbi:MAG: hypothetical protein LBC67_00905 [Spirochaetales bacterium]|jgi:hypothetical protein|nr:hypothetical protein [Spirochaetales bacterium]
MNDDIRIGHSEDAIDLLDRILESRGNLPRKELLDIIRAVKDAIERGIA